MSLQQKVTDLTSEGVFGEGSVKVTVGEGVITLTLAKPRNLNALTATMTKGLMAGLELCKEFASQIRVVLLRAEGRVFCAGGDAKSLAGNTQDEVHSSSMAFGSFLQLLTTLPQLVVGVAQGSAYGGGFGLLSCCDIVVAVPTAEFALSEVRLGMIPATISPHVVRKIGVNNSRRLFLTGEKFSASKAKEYGLVNEIVEPEKMKSFLEGLIKQQSLCAPIAVARAKNLITLVENKPVTEELIRITVDELVSIRTGPEIREGAAALFNKRKPQWAKDGLRAKL
eukprot:TRINITY_DN112_c3_g1_i1.p1 TRINITY_DN112_c3_g1~~TRINITY_DN112_c3_g1_i1.p1  ORF type:complete len:282 (+),score=45.41 TRINITY_DN112_c3_g1_i1:54-899(+)